MSGKTDAHLRSGFLAESIGFYFMRSIGAVAEVHRAEDHGIDAFWTLLKPESERLLIPGVTVLMQLKASSVTSIPIQSEQEMDWLRNLELPLFYGRVTRPGKGSPRLEIYTSHLLYDELLHRPSAKVSAITFEPQRAKGYTLRWLEDMNNPGDDGPNPGGFYPRSHGASQSDSPPSIWLGPPIATISIDDLEDDYSLNAVRNCIWLWAKIEGYNRSVSHLGVIQRVRWKANQNDLQPWIIQRPVPSPKYHLGLALHANSMLHDKMRSARDDEFDAILQTYFQIIALAGCGEISPEQILKLRQQMKPS